MKLKDLQRNWDEFGKTDPLWAIMTDEDKKGNQWEEKDFFQTGEKTVEETLNYIESLGINLSYGACLDFGCGVGRLTQALSTHFDRTHGVDIARSMIEKANQYNRHGDKCSYHLNEVNDLSLFSDNSFDLVVTKITLQHMRPEYAMNYIKEFLRVLVPKGVLVFQLPCELKPEFFAMQGQREEPNMSRFQKIKLKIKPSTPEFALKLYRLLKNAMETVARSVRSNKQSQIEQQPPVMEMYGSTPDTIKNVIESSGGTILDVSEDTSAGEWWTSFLYCAIKNPVTTGK